MASSVWGTQFWNGWTAQGGKPEFYQVYFEPAVMVACGHGFVISEHQPKALEDFLWRRRDTLTCSDLPADLTLGTHGIYQGAWIYLEYTVGLFWRVMGISWSRMGPLLGLFFGTVTALAYAIFRLGMGRLFALGGAVAMAVSSAQLLNLPHLRDYAKAPFTLALVLIIGLLVTRPVRPRRVLLLAAAYGAVLGFGYGFRTDFLVSLPVIVIVLFAFLESGLTQHLLLRAAASLLSFAIFIAVSSPVLSSVYERGGCQWHVALLGLQLPFDKSLHIVSAPYDFGYVYADGYVVRSVSGYARRAQSDFDNLVYCSREYDIESGRYLKEIVASFPADLTVRAYASVLQIVELPFQVWTAPMKGWATKLYRVREKFLEPRMRAGACVMVLALLMVSAVSLRLGMFLLFFVAYFGGYPAVQFQERHYFHLEFMTWWALGFVAYHAMGGAWSLRGRMPAMRSLVLPVARAAALVVAAGILFASLLGVARWYQGRQVRRLLNAYVTAPKIPLEAPGGALREVPSGAWPQYLEVSLNEGACASRPSITFRYNRVPVDGDFTRTITIGRGAPGSGPTRVFLPVFEQFAGLEFSDARPGCVLGAYRFIDLNAFPLLLGVTLPPDWESRPLYQRLSLWDGNQS